MKASPSRIVSFVTVLLGGFLTGQVSISAEAVSASVHSAVAAEVTLESRVIFEGEGGKPLPVEAGSYFVEPVGNKALRLTPAFGRSVTIVAQPGEHEEDLLLNLALVEPWEEDELHIVLYMPEAKSLDARGSLSGIQSRGVMRMPSIKKYQTRISTAVNEKARRLYSTTSIRVYRPFRQPESDASSLGYPHVTSTYPSDRGMVGGEIKFTGIDFDTTHFTAKLGDTNLQIVSRTTTEVRALLPNQKQVANLKVSHGAPNNEYVLKYGYEIAAPAVVASVSPESFARGELVTVRGTDLDLMYPSGRNNKKYVKLSNSSDSQYGEDMLEVAGWQVSPDRKTVQFNIREVWSISSVRVTKMSPQPTSLSGKMRFTPAGTTRMTLVSPRSVSWEYEPGIVVDSIKSSRWDSNFIIVVNDILQNHVEVEGRGLYSSTDASINGLAISQVGVDYRGQHGWLRIPYEAQTGPVLFTRDGFTGSSPTLWVLHGPDFVPGTFEQFGIPAALEIQVGQNYMLQGWELAPSGVSGLVYEFALSGLPSAGCGVKLQIVEHTKDRIKFRVDQTGSIPAGCDSSILFGGSGSTWFVMTLKAKYDGRSMEFIRKPYYLTR